MTYKDIFGWFPDEHAEILGELIEKHKVKTILEIGAFLGRSTAFFADKVDKVTVIDPFIMWEEGNNNGDARHYGGESFLSMFRINMHQCEVEKKVEEHQGTSEHVWPTLKNREFDLIYIDGSHKYEDVQKDLLMYFGCARLVICGDDYDENWPGVERAVREFFGGSKINVKVHGRVWYVELYTGDVA